MVTALRTDNYLPMLLVSPSPVCGISFTVHMKCITQSVRWTQLSLCRRLIRRAHRTAGYAHVPGSFRKSAQARPSSSSGRAVHQHHQMMELSL